MRKAAVILATILVALLCIFIADRGFRDWKGPLEEVIQSADRLVVAPMSPRDGNAEPAILDIVGSDQVEELIGLMEIDAWRSASRCMCYGDTAFEFYKGDEKLATITLAHGIALKWPNDPWRADAHLTVESQSALSAWLKERDYTQVWKGKATRSHDP